MPGILIVQYIALTFHVGTDPEINQGGAGCMRSQDGSVMEYITIYVYIAI